MKRTALIFAVLIAPTALAIALPEIATANVQYLDAFEDFTSASSYNIKNISQGSVLGPDGKTVSGVSVRALWWPAPEQIVSDTPGSVIEPMIVDSVTSADNGSYTLSAAGLGSAAVSDASVEIIADLNGETLSQFVSVTTSGLGTNVRITTQGSEDPSLKMYKEGILNDDAATALDFYFTGIPDVDPEATAHPENRSSPENTVQELSVSRINKAQACDLLSSHVVNTIINGSYSTVAGGHTRSFEYSSGTTSTLGMATVSKGKYVSSGTTKVKGGGGASSYGPVSNKGGTLYKTQFKYGKYRCYLPITLRPYIRVIPIGWHGGATTTSLTTASIPSTNQCATYSSNTGARKYRGSGSTWTAGVEASSFLGINLTATTSYSENHELNFWLTSNRQLCGQNASPITSNGRVVVK